MKIGKEKYFKALSAEGTLDQKPVTDLLDAMAKKRVTLECVPEKLLRQSRNQYKVTDYLSRLELRVATGPTSWGGLVVGFPGSTSQLTTEAVSTPYLRKILYPMLDLHQRINDHYEGRLPCLYLLGVRFPDVFLRKFLLLSQVVPHVIMLTNDLLKLTTSTPPESSGKDNEQRVQAKLCAMMSPTKDKRVPPLYGDTRLRYLAHELQTGEGTQQPERLDILAVDDDDHSLVAFEIKGPNPQRVELENLFLQGLEHRKWLELNKMGVKLMLEGPRGKRINTRKRVRLVLGSFAQEPPEHFVELRRQAVRHDRHLQIDFVKFAWADTDAEKLLVVQRT